MTDRSKLLAVAEVSNALSWFYAFDEDAEWFAHGGDTYEQALAEALPEQEGRPIYIQQAKRMMPNLSELALADNVIDAIQDQECWGEDGALDLGDPQDLQARLDAAVQKWFAECCSLMGASLDFVGKQYVVPAPEKTS